MGEAGPVTSGVYTLGSAGGGRLRMKPFPRARWVLGPRGVWLPLSDKGLEGLETRRAGCTEDTVLPSIKSPFLAFPSGRRDLKRLRYMISRKPVADSQNLLRPKFLSAQKS